MKRLLNLGLGILVSQWCYAQPTCPTGIPADICQFETKVYTSTDFKNTDQVRQVMTGLKALMMAHSADSSMIQEHLLTLADQIVEEAYNQRAPKSILALADGKRMLTDMLKVLKPWEAKNGQIVPLDWHLPKGFVIAVANLDRSYDVASGRVRFGISFFASLDQQLEVEQFQVIRYPGAVVIDKNAGIGSWNAGATQLQVPYLSASSAWQESPFQDGLYLLNIKVKGQDAVNGWFYLHGTSATSPVVLSPQINEKLHTPTPTFTFQDFKSNAKLSSDHRKRSLAIYREGDNQELWNTKIINPLNGTRLTLGQDANQNGVNALVAGSYRLNLSFEERSYFGDITIGRLSNTTVVFGITK